jgi:hypothetical protein
VRIGVGPSAVAKTREVPTSVLFNDQKIADEFSYCALEPTIPVIYYPLVKDKLTVFLRCPKTIKEKSLEARLCTYVAPATMK